jgi:hypothetical protein
MPNHTKKAASTPTWATTSMEPKRKYKYILVLGEIPTWVVKSAKRPSFSVTTPQEHPFMGHVFKFPGRVKWDPMEIVLMDPINPEVASKVLGIVEDAGYVTPDQWGDDPNKALWLKTLSKRRFVNGNLGVVSIQTLDSEGVVVEEWQLHNVQITKVDYGALDYGSEELLTVTVSLAFDFAKHSVKNQGA